MESAIREIERYIANNPNEISARFWKNVNCGLSLQCWRWRSRSQHCGYGWFGVRGQSFTSNRIVWLLVNGVIPDGLFVCHSCDIRLCCNPGHLFLGTHLDNMADRTSKGRAPRGSRCGVSKVTEADVIQMRNLREVGLTFKRLGEMFGISDKETGLICNRKRWEWLK
jgi:hypothetical protein